MICWVPGCGEDEHQTGTCRAHHAEGERVSSMVLSDPYVERCDVAYELSLIRRADTERAAKELQRRKAEMQQAKWRLTGRVPRMDDSIDRIRHDLAADMSAGSRNAAMNRGGYRLGRLVGGGVLTRTEAEAMLQQAADAHRLPRHEAKYVIARSLDEGADNPYLTTGR